MMGRCPLLCLLKSKDLSHQTRLDIFNKIVNTFSIPLSQEVEEQLKVVKEKANENAASSSQSESMATYLPIYNPNNLPNNEHNNTVQITKVLSTDEKIELYKSVMSNNVELFQSLIKGSPNKQLYPMFEEVSAENLGWAPLHYAMHYAKWDIINLFLNIYSKKI